MSIDPEAETPVYQQLAAILRIRIQSGEFSRRLPSLKSLEQEYGVSHGSVEKAVARLRDEGLVRSVIGKGYFVVPPGERRSQT